MNPLEIYNALPEPVKQICIGAAGDIFANVVGGAWTALTNKDCRPGLRAHLQAMERRITR